MNNSIIDRIENFLWNLIITCIAAVSVILIYRLIKIIFINFNDLFFNVSYCFYISIASFILFIFLEIIRGEDKKQNNKEIQNVNKKKKVVRKNKKVKNLQ